MIKIIASFAISSLFLISNYSLADTGKLSNAIKLISTGEAMHVKIVSKVRVSTNTTIAKANLDQN